MSLDQEQYEKLEAYVGGELNPAARAEVEMQLAGNPQLRKLLAELVQTRDLVRGLPRAAAPADLIETFQGQIERAELFGDTGRGDAEVLLKINRWPQYMSVAAVIFLALGLAGIIYKVVLPHNKPNGGFVIAPTGEGTSAFDDKKGYERDGAATAPTIISDRTKSVSPLLSTATGDIALSSAPSPMTVARDDTRSHISSTDLQRIQTQLADTTAAARNPLDEPIVMVVRSDNPQHANAEVRGYFDANFINFDTATQPLASANRSGDIHPEAILNIEAEAKAAAPVDRAMQRSRAAPTPDRGLRQDVAQNADPQSQVVSQQPTSGPTFGEGNNELAGRQQGANQRFSNSAAGFAYNAATTAPGIGQTPQVFGGGAGDIKLGVNNAQTQPSGGNIYRAMLTQRQLRDLNSKLQSQGNQWTELRGGLVSDAIEGNPVSNAINNTNNAAKSRASEIFAKAEKEKAVETRVLAGAEPPTSQPATAPATGNAALRELSKDVTDLSARRSFAGTATTQPATAPAKDEVLAKLDAAVKDELREVVIVVNEQPIDLLGTGVPSTQPAAAPAQTQPVAATQPATTSPAK